MEGERTRYEKVGEPLLPRYCLQVTLSSHLFAVSSYPSRLLHHHTCHTAGKHAVAIVCQPAQNGERREGGSQMTSTASHCSPSYMHRPQKFNHSPHSVSAFMPAYSTAAFSERKLSEKGGVALLQYFGVSYSRVGHVCVHAARPFPCWACACTASDSLVVAERVIAKSEVVHAALRCSACPKCLQYDVDDTLRSEHIPSNNSCCFGWVENGALRYTYANRIQAALVERYLAVD
mmetsp:Transcript_37107/g.96231  ORF Transcript_37107/g.96231 Transcript_37107/m.96231 type:complete len:233 (-) Transcript_37107:1966-2664(-)